MMSKTMRAWLLIAAAALLAACQPLAPRLPEEPEPPVRVDGDVAGQVEVESPPACECPVPSCPAPERPPTPVCAPAPLTDRHHFAGKLVVGSIEYVHVEPGSLRLEARVDSGAETSSMHADDVVSFERDGEPWVRFSTPAGTSGSSATMELPVARRVRIKTKTDGIDRRAVVMINLRLGEVTKRIEVTLADRGDFEYPFLVGRNYLRDVAVVDVSRRYIHGD